MKIIYGLAVKKYGEIYILGIKTKRLVVDGPFFDVFGDRIGCFFGKRIEIDFGSVFVKPLMLVVFRSIVSEEIISL